MHDEIIRQTITIVGDFFVVYLILYSTYLFLATVVGSITLHKNKYYNLMHNQLPSIDDIPISIIVPAYNEELTVIDTIESLLCIDYKAYEIIVVDEGSTDATTKKLVEYFKMNEVKRAINKQIHCMPVDAIYETVNYKVPITVIKKQNGGKSDALNMGINASNYEYFISMDADSVLQKDSLQKMVEPILENDNLVACGGFISISNGITFKNGEIEKYRVPDNILVCMQILEYDRSFLASRIMFDYFNGNLIVSGAFGLFKKEYVLAVSGYDTNTLGEDFEIIVKLHTFCCKHKIDYSIKYVPDAICWTQAPENFKDLIKQRRRWYTGLFQGMVKYVGMLGNPQFGLIGYISYTYFLLYELLAPFIEILGIIMLVIASLYGMLYSISFTLVFVLAYAAFGAVLSLTTFLARIHVKNLKLTFADLGKAILGALLEITVFRYTLNVHKIMVLLRYKKNKSSWNKFNRTKMDSKTDVVNQ